MVGLMVEMKVDMRAAWWDPRMVDSKAERSAETMAD
jgi:hypothetical protein